MVVNTKITLPTVDTSIAINWSNMTITIPDGVNVIRVLTYAWHDNGLDVGCNFTITHPDSGRSIDCYNGSSNNSINYYIKVTPGMIYDISWEDWGEMDEWYTECEIYYSASINTKQTSNDLTY